MSFNQNKSRLLFGKENSQVLFQVAKDFLEGLNLIRQMNQKMTTTIFDGKSSQNYFH